MSADIHYICDSCRKAEGRFEVEYEDAIYSVCQNCLPNATGEPKIRERKYPLAKVIPLPRRSGE